MSEFVSMALGALLVLAWQDKRWAQLVVATLCGMYALEALADGDFYRAAFNAIGLLWLWQPAPRPEAAK